MSQPSPAESLCSIGVCAVLFVLNVVNVVVTWPLWAGLILFALTVMAAVWSYSLFVRQRRSQGAL